MNNINYETRHNTHNEFDDSAYQISFLTKIDIAKRMILSGIDNKSIADITELNVNDIDNLKL